MRINITSVHFKTDKKLDDFINEKLEKLKGFYNGVLAGEVTLRIDKNDKRENKITEIKIEIPGNDLFVKKQSKSFEEATDEAVEALRKQLIKYKEKVRDK
jgi:putative sigma-54 modulation protein